MRDGESNRRLFHVGRGRCVLLLQAVRRTAARRGRSGGSGRALVVDAEVLTEDGEIINSYQMITILIIQLKRIVNFSAFVLFG